MVEVLAFLFENFLHRQIDIQAHFDQIARELPQVGFDVEEVDGAMDWLDETLRSERFDTPLLKESRSPRLFTALEIAKIDNEARGMIYFLSNNCLITPSIRELLIDRAMALRINTVTKTELRWVLLFVMMNTHARQDVLEWIEASLADAMKNNKKNSPEIETES